jgi:hypothetical protein
MPTQTITRSAESDSEPIQLYNILAEGGNIPKWAPAFADAVERINEGHYRVMKNGETFKLEVFLHRSAGTVDYIRPSISPNPNRQKRAARRSSRTKPLLPASTSDEIRR